MQEVKQYPVGKLLSPEITENAVNRFLLIRLDKIKLNVIQGSTLKLQFKMTTNSANTATDCYYPFY